MEAEILYPNFLLYIGNHPMVISLSFLLFHLHCVWILHFCECMEIKWLLWNMVPWISKLFVNWWRSVFHKRCVVSELGCGSLWKYGTWIFCFLIFCLCSQASWKVDYLVMAWLNLVLQNQIVLQHTCVEKRNIVSAFIKLSCLWFNFVKSMLEVWKDANSLNSFVR